MNKGRGTAARERVISEAYTRAWRTFAKKKARQRSGDGEEGAQWKGTAATPTTNNKVAAPQASATDGGSLGDGKSAGAGVGAGAVMAREEYKVTRGSVKSDAARNVSAVSPRRLPPMPRNPTAEPNTPVRQAPHDVQWGALARIAAMKPFMHHARALDDLVRHANRLQRPVGSTVSDVGSSHGSSHDDFDASDTLLSRDSFHGGSTMSD